MPSYIINFNVSTDLEISNILNQMSYRLLSAYNLFMCCYILLILQTKCNLYIFTYIIPVEQYNKIKIKTNYTFTYFTNLIVLT